MGEGGNTRRSAMNTKRNYDYAPDRERLCPRCGYQDGDILSSNGSLWHVCRECQLRWAWTYNLLRGPKLFEPDFIHRGMEFILSTRVIVRLDAG